MSFQDEITLELIKTGLNLLVALITLGFGWLIGNQLSARVSMAWAIRQKKRELELETASLFYKVYGEFFAVWKLWVYHKEQNFGETSRWAMLERATTAEGMLESIFVKLSSERQLGEKDIEILGRFRQGYQTLRQSIRDDKYLGWSKDKHSEYISFKRLAGLVSDILVSDSPSKKKSSQTIDEALTQITSNKWEKQWFLTVEDWMRLKVR